MFRKSGKRTKANIKVQVVDKKSLIDVRFTSPPLLQASQLTAVGSPDPSKLQILVGAEAFRRIDEHTKSDLGREVGGFLVGRPYQWNEQTYVEIVTALQAETTSSSAVHLTISPDTWMQAQEEIRATYPDMYIVGWYHTHPRFSVFMSAQDIEIHRGFFRELWHVALVIDPSQQKAGFFIWDNGEIQLANGYQVLYPPDIGEEEKWQNPSSPVDTLMGAKEQTLEQFYEANCWHTRWQTMDEIVVKITHSAMVTLDKRLADASRYLVGVCIGKLEPNLHRSSPRWFIEVHDFYFGHTDTLDNIEYNEIVNRVKSQTLAAAEGKIPVGLLYAAIEPLASHDYLSELAQVLSSRIKFILVGSMQQGVTSCLWKKSGGELIERKIVKMVKLAELSDDGLGKTIDKVKAALTVQANMVEIAQHQRRPSSGRSLNSED